MVQGNFTESEAIDMFSDSLEILNISEDYNYNYDITLHLQLPEARHVIKRKNLNPTNNTSFEKWYWQIGKTPFLGQTEPLN